LIRLNPIFLSILILGGFSVRADLPDSQNETEQNTSEEYSNLYGIYARLDRAQKSGDIDETNRETDRLRRAFEALQTRYGARILKVDVSGMSDTEFRVRVAQGSPKAANDNWPGGMDFIARRLFDIVDKTPIMTPVPTIDTNKTIVMPAPSYPSGSGWSIR
jgi:hypothetical protein